MEVAELDKSSFGAFMAAIWRLGESDRPAAIRLLEGAQGHDSFYPWGAHALMAFSFREGFEAEARAVAHEIGQRTPEFRQAWWLQIILARGTPGYIGVCRRIIKIGGSNPDVIKGEILASLLESALAVRSSESNDTLGRCLAAGLLRAIDVTNCEKAMAFLSKVSDEWQVLGKTARLEGWRFGVVSGSLCPALLAEGRIAVVNLARLGVDGLDGWDRSFAERVAIAVSGITGWAPYLDDSGVSFWSRVSYEDRFAAIFWRLAYAPIEWLHLRPINQSASPTAPEPMAVRRCRFSDTIFDRKDALLFVRPGNVEIWALWSGLLDPKAAQQAAENVAIQAISAADGGGRLVARYELPWTDAVENITRLNTNAGWYSRPGSASASYTDWVERYSAALCCGSLLAAHVGDLLPLAALLPPFRKQQPQAWREEGMFQLLDDANVVFATAFASEAQEHFQTGRLGMLWDELDVNARIRSLQTVVAPMSIWPYYPHDNWSESFELLCVQSSTAIERIQANLFVASCGAYGLPLVHAMHKRFGITCLYGGHQANICFGIATASIMQGSIFAHKPKARYWLYPDLSQKYPEVSRIDNGRYVQPREPPEYQR